MKKKQEVQSLNIVQNAKLASTKLLQLRTEIHRVKYRVVTINNINEYSGTIPYDIIAVGAATTHALVKVGAQLVGAYWPTAAAEDWSQAAKYKFLITSPDPDESVPQAVNMNDFQERYPHLGEWDGSAADAVAKIAALLRYDTVAKAEDKRPNFHVLVQLWRPSSNRRWRELCAAIRRNAENPFVHRVHVLLESSGAAEAWIRWPQHLKDKIVAVERGERLTYRAARDYLAGLPEGDYAALANTDIFFDETIRDLWSLDLTGKCLALLRYEASLAYAERVEGAAEPTIFGPRDDSQDSWIFRVADLKAASDWGPLNFTLGQAGCDNAFAGELVRRRWTVANPCMSIKTMHVHESGIRTYREDDRVTLGVYATLAPCGLLESVLLGASKFNVAATLKARSVNTFRVESWAGGLAGHGAYQRGLTALYKSVQPTRIGSEVTWTDHTLKVLSTDKESVVTEDGLIAIDNGIGFSADREASELAWAQTDYSALTPLVAADTGLFLPFTSGCVGDDMLQLGRALWLSESVGAATMPCAAERLMASLQNKVTLKNIQGKALLCKKAYGFLPSLALNAIVEPAVAALRSTIRVESRDPGGWVIFSVDAELVNSLYEITEEELPITHISNPNVPPARILYPMSAAKVIVGGTTACGYLWSAPVGATFIDLEPCQASLNMATVCGLKYIPLGLEATMLTEDKARILLDAGKWSNIEAADGDKPVLYMPSAREGYHGHPGDSFRELAELWAEAGYVRRQYHDGVFCWLGGIGDKLLYDRDTHEWLGKAPEAETKWTDAVFANEVGDKKPWIYWARRPRLLVAREPVAERKRDLVFYGKIENSTQFKRRAAKATGKDWSTVCDEFEMPVGGKYKYTQAEYLDRLAEARFGLCLPGFGPKCHREIECMALGTVPIVTPGIDVNGYAEPLIKGVHYLFAETPESAKRLVAEMPEDTWATMSAAGRAWYDRNCSVAGSWATTQKQLGM